MKIISFSNVRFNLIKYFLSFFHAYELKHFGRMLSLPENVVEVYLPRHILEPTNCDGWCINRKYLTSLMEKLSLSSSKAHHALRDIINVLTPWESKLNENVNTIILIKKGECSSFKKWTQTLLIYNSMINHERVHATTMHESLPWHYDIDIFMWENFTHEWDECLIALYSSDDSVYTDIYVMDGENLMSFIWQGTEELIARIVSLMLTPNEKRDIIANIELPYNPQALCKLTAGVESIWRDPERFLSYIKEHTA